MNNFDLNIYFFMFSFLPSILVFLWSETHLRGESPHQSQEQEAKQAHQLLYCGVLERTAIQELLKNERNTENRRN